MSAEIENELKKKCAYDSRLAILDAQWVYDKQMIGQALQTIGGVFPHYSLHDASHSKSILVQITRILGSRVEKLSATDLWLLLEAAYWHDMGMVVDDETLRNWWKSNEFQEHIESLIDHDDWMLSLAAKLLKKQCIPDDQSHLDVKQAITLVVADFVRGKHADRSGELVMTPSRVGVASPRSLIPDRLWRWVSKIAIAHGRPEDYLIQIPQTECGMGADTCHPRFVACMLRLGDLLDLDNGRFCPVLASTFGTRPPSSLAHVGKHAAIRRFRVSPEKIEVEAVCSKETLPEGADNYEVYEAVSMWLDWLEKEVRMVSSHWADIAPVDFGSAPSTGKIEATLEDSIYLRKGERPRFRVDEPAFLQLIRSSRLYEDNYAWMRELVSNAEDATRIRAFAENHEATILDSKDEVSNLTRIRKILEPYPIDIRITEASESPQKGLRIKIADNGTGISKKDLEFILTIGSSRKNPDRRKIIRKMPDWLKPTGSFGIGLQSAFMATDEIQIRTMHYRTRERLKITIRRRPEDGINGQQGKTALSTIIVENLPETEEPLKPGTHIEFLLKSMNWQSETAHLEQGPDEIQNAPIIKNLVKTTGRKRPMSSLKPSKSDHAESISPSQINSKFQIDPILNELGLFEREAVENRFVSVIEKMQATVSINGQRASHLDNQYDSYYDNETDCAITFLGFELADNEVEVRYRGQKVSNHRIRIGFLKIAIDIHSGSAPDYLSANRDTLTSQGTKKVTGLIFDSLSRLLPCKIQKLEANKTNRQVYSKEVLNFRLASWFLEAKQTNQTKLLRSIDKAEIFTIGEKLVKLGALPEDFIFVDRFPPTIYQSYDQITEFDMAIVQLKDQQTTLPNCLHGMLLALRSFVEFQGVQDGRRFYYASNNSRDPVSTNIFGKLLANLPFTATPTFIRPSLPCPSNFQILAMDYTELPSWANSENWLVRTLLVSPFEFRMRDQVEVSLRHLSYYVTWILDQKKSPNPDDTLRKGVELEIIQFAKILIEKTRSVVDDQGQPFTLEAVKRALGS